jgi:hypothetical protein
MGLVPLRHGPHTWFMLTPRRTVVFTALVATLLTLGACAAPEPAPTSSPSNAPDATSQPTSAPAKPALADLVLSTSGLGPLRLGEPVAEEPADVAVVVYDPTGCVGEPGELEAGDPGAGLWRPTYPEDRPFEVVTEGRAQGGAIVNIQVGAPPVATEADIRVGSSLDELLAAYPAMPAPTNEFVSLYTLEDPAGKLVFEVAPATDDTGYWQPEQLDTVVYMTAYAPGQTVSAVYATDSAGACSV